MKASRDIDKDLASTDPEVRRRATAAIADLSPAEGADFVLRALGDSDWRVRKEAGSVAALLGPADPLLDKLVTALFPGDNVGLRNAVVETLASYGRSAIPAVTRIFHRLDADGKKLAAEVLGRAHDPIALEALEQLYADPDPNVRTAALEAIADIGSLAVDAASRTLLAALDADDDTHLRLAALEGLNRLGIVVPWEKLRPLTGHRILGRAALAAAAVVSEPAGVDLAIDALVDDAVAREADAALRIYGPPAMPRLLARVANGAAELRAAAIGRLSDLVEKGGEENARLALRAALA